MTIEKTAQGAWRISAMVRGFRVTHIYYGFTKREAMALFNEETKS